MFWEGRGLGRIWGAAKAGECPDGVSDGQQRSWHFAFGTRASRRRGAAVAAAALENGAGECDDDNNDDVVSANFWPGQPLEGLRQVAIK